MARIYRLLLLSLLLPVTARAACNLQISMSCSGFDGNGTAKCSTTTLNAGNMSCGGEFIAGVFASAPTSQVQIHNFQTSLGLDFCLGTGDVPSGGESGAFGICAGEALLPAGAQFFSNFDVTIAQGAAQTLPLIGLTGVYDLETGDELAFVYAFQNAEVPTCTPTISAPPASPSNVGYFVSWSEVSQPNATYEIQESTTPDFANPTTTTTTERSARFVHAVGSTTTYYYRVRATSCGGSTNTTFSATASTVVQALETYSSKSPIDVVIPETSSAVLSIPVHIDAPQAKTALDVAFTASTDKPFLTVTPSSGTIPPGGTTVTVSANPVGLPAGANTGTLNVTANGASLAKTPITISRVTPVEPSGKSIPPGNALIIPVVTHVQGASGPFQSDVRLTNGGAADIRYAITFTPSGNDGTKVGRKTELNVAPGQTIALNDIVKDFFGFGATGQPSDSGFGVLEIRPLNNSSPLTFASSRTYASTPTGTFGQFIAAVPFSKFASNAGGLVPLPGGSAGGTPVLSLQQIAQSSKFRTNLGIVEGSGSPASGVIRVFDDLGTLLKSVDFSLQPGEHRQINSFLAVNGIPTLDDGRIEIAVTSDTARSPPTRRSSTT
ncbi:MAG: hypothetical protein JOZ54_17970 [Acidobacteria bacterium]|nr:hypothetical protein [Acidobacteriota bacterium]